MRGSAAVEFAVSDLDAFTSTLVEDRDWHEAAAIIIKISAA